LSAECVLTAHWLNMMFFCHQFCILESLQMHHHQFDVCAQSTVKFIEGAVQISPKFDHF